MNSILFISVQTKPCLIQNQVQKEKTVVWIHSASLWSLSQDRAFKIHTEADFISQSF